MKCSSKNLLIRVLTLKTDDFDSVMKLKDINSCSKPKINSFIRNSAFKTSQRMPDFHRPLDCMPLATLDPPCLRSLAAPQLSQLPTFPESVTYFKTF